MMSRPLLPNPVVKDCEEAGNSGTVQSLLPGGGGTARRNSGGMVGEELEAAAGECKFPNVRKTYWRSATWNSLSAPPSPNKIQPLPLLVGGGGGGGGGTEPLTPRSHQQQQQQQQSTKARASLPPLQPLAITRRSLEEWPRAGLDDMSDWTTPATPGRRRVKTGPEIKLDIASVQRTAVEPTEIQLKRDKFAFFDKECSLVDEHIYLGSDAVARNRETLRANGITHVLNCVGFVCPEYFKKDLTYKTLWLQDSPCEDITSLLYDVFDYFEEVRDQGGRVFVHCCQGVSRSTSLVIAYLMWQKSWSFEEAFQVVKRARGVTNPNMGFACQLLQCQKRVHAAPMSPNSVLRMYRLAPHSPYDPLHLVPKTVNTPGAAALDSRGAFVIHVPNAIYVWIGQASDPKIAHAAKMAADQVVRYERAQGPLSIVNEGQEDPEFWESLCKYPVSTDECDKAGLGSPVEEDGGYKEPDSQTHRRRGRAGEQQVERVRRLGVGNRKVASYDVDFELYQRVRQGGVVPPVPSSGIGVATVPTRVPAREDGWSVLRRKFWGKELGVAAKTAGNLVSPAFVEMVDPPRETGTIEKQDTNSLSPDPSMCSCSPHFSPGPSPGCESPFESPLSLSLSGNPSPSKLQVISPCSSQASSSPDSSPCNPSPSHSDHPLFSSNLMPIPQSTSKGPAVSLAQRRGSVSPSLRLPDPPPAPRGMSRKPRLPPLVTIEKSKVELGAKENGDPGFRFDGLDELCSGLANEVRDHKMQDRDVVENDSEPPLDSAATVNEQQSMESSMQVYGIREAAQVNEQGQHDPHIENASVESESQLSLPGRPGEVTHGLGLPILYEWPRMERLDMFDADDLDTRAVFVLIASQPGDGRHGQVVYVWVGRDLIAEKESETHQNDASDAKGEAMWLQVGYNFIEHMHLWRDIPIRVVKEGQEPEEFWENFNHG